MVSTSSAPPPTAAPLLEPLQVTERLRAPPEHRPAPVLAVVEGSRVKSPRGGLVVGFQDEQLALTADPGEGAPMEGARAPAVERGEVLRGRVALVAGEAVLRKA